MIPVVVISIFIVSVTAQQVFVSDQKVGLALIGINCFAVSYCRLNKSEMGHSLFAY